MQTEVCIANRGMHSQQRHKEQSGPPVITAIEPSAVCRLIMTFNYHLTPCGTHV